MEGDYPEGESFIPSYLIEGKRLKAGFSRRIWLEPRA